jgi:hypothetical protein
MKLVLLTAIAATLTFSAASLAAVNTTAPSKTISILVVINDKEIIVAPQLRSSN